MSYIFPKQFRWGVATASYQIEGAVQEDGKCESIWDRFSHIPGNIRNNENGDRACDFYHRFADDIKKIHEMEIPYFRFSIAWPRICPDDGGKINEDGFAFYEKVICELEKYNIKPVVTLYHWDMPQWLQDQGGWQNRKSIACFKQYAEAVFERFHKKVDTWITLNEPWVCAFNGHYWGDFAPGIRDFSAALQTAHHMLCAHGETVKVFREKGYKGEIGITLNLCPRENASDRTEDIQAAQINDGFSNRWFLDPVFKGKYPEDMENYYKGKGVRLPRQEPRDMQIISEEIDFLGINYYNIEFTSKCEGRWPLDFEICALDHPVTEYGWPIVERGLTELLVRIKEEYGNPRIIVTENGASYLDSVNIKGEVLDDNRIDYLERHIISCHKAIEQGVRLEGYFVWTLLDDFEWPTGYHNRFGLIYVDHRDQKRTIKKSGYWYANVIRDNGIKISE